MQEQLYLPSSSERKRAITAYLLIGLLFFSGKEELTLYEYFHFKQAIGRYVHTMALLLLRLMLIWLPIVRWLPFLFVLVNLLLLVTFVFKARKGEYFGNVLHQPKRKMFYADIGGWILGIFEVKKRVYGDIALDNASEITTLPPENSSD